MTSEKLAFLKQLRPFVASEEAYGRMHADLQDLLEASEWLIGTVGALRDRKLSISELEDLLVEIDVSFIEHASYHLASLRGDIKSTLENFPDAESQSCS